MSEVSYTLKEEIANALSHGLAAILSVAALAVMVGVAAAQGASALTMTSVSIFGASMFVLYTASTLYHAITLEKAKRILKLLDHSAIFLLIAGTYTPFCLVTLQNSLGLELCIAVWVIAIAGISLQGFLIKRAKWVNALLYLAMGWLVVFAINPIIESLPTGGLVLLLLGGLSYSFGVIFYVCKRIPYNHAIWHIFVLAGTALQFFSILLYVIPQGTNS